MDLCSVGANSGSRYRLSTGRKAPPSLGFCLYSGHNRSIRYSGSRFYRGSKANGSRPRRLETVSLQKIEIWLSVRPYGHQLTIEHIMAFWQQPLAVFRQNPDTPRLDLPC